MQFGIILLVLVGALSFGSGCATPKRGQTPASSVKEVDEDAGKVDVYLIPIGKFDLDSLKHLCRALSRDLKIKVRPTTDLVVTGLQPAYGTNYYSLDETVSHLYRVMDRFPDRKVETAYIVLFGKLMGAPDQPSRVFGMHNRDHRVGAVAVESLAEGLMVRSRTDAQRFASRCYKIVKQQIGATYFDYPISSNKRDVMYFPPLSTLEVDEMGSAFLEVNGKEN